MSTFSPRTRYTQEELDRLYPKELQLQLVQVLLRHGERSPVSPRFQDTGLAAYWPYCNAARNLTGVIMSTKDWTKFDELKYRRRLETFGEGDVPIAVTGPSKEIDGICLPGELTDRGRETTIALGRRLRHLYVDQLRFMPAMISNSDMIFLRSTPIPRALESVQQAFWGLYPSSTRSADFPPTTIFTRTPADETLYPNDGNCRRFAQLSRAFAQRTADRWNDSPQMDYLNKKISQYMPPNSKRVAVDSHPRLSGIMDTINATSAHGPATRLPKNFYDQKVRDIIDKIGVEEWYSGFEESNEYRMVGIGALAGDLVNRMTGSVERDYNDGLLEIGGEGASLAQERREERDIKLSLSGCHDTSLAGLLSALGCFEGEKWPPFTSHIAIELFRDQKSVVPDVATPSAVHSNQKAEMAPVLPKGWWAALFGSSSKPGSNPQHPQHPQGIGRKPLAELTPAQRDRLRGYYVRLRYNDRVMQVPTCKAEGKHLDSDTTFCTLAAFKGVVDKFTPRSWKQSCMSNLDAPVFPDKPEPAGYD